MMKKGIIYNLSPFNNETNMSKAEYVIKKVLAFIMIYIFSALLGEAVVIGVLYGMGYDPLHGVMPNGQISELIFYYGFFIFSAITLLYCRFIEKKKIMLTNIWRKIKDYIFGALIATILLVIIICINCIIGAMNYCGLNANISIESLMLWLIAFFIQGATEEIMCRGFLLYGLKKRISIPLAIFISSTAFVVPHLSSLIEAEFIYAMIGIINIYLISIIFSILVLWRGNIWIACGLHSIWNFILYSVMGLSLSGSESVSKGVILFKLEKANIFNGAEYGIEASVITIIVLSILLCVVLKKWKGEKSKNGIS